MIEKIFEAYTKQRKLTDEHKEGLKKIAEIDSRLDELPSNLAEVVDRLTHSFPYGILSILSMFLLAYLPSANLDAIASFWSQILVMGSLSVFLYRYLADGVSQIRVLRNFEKLTNSIERCDTFKQLYQLTQD